jgi:hypothetical protein
VHFGLGVLEGELLQQRKSRLVVGWWCELERPRQERAALGWVQPSKLAAYEPRRFRDDSGARSIRVSCGGDDVSRFRDPYKLMPVVSRLITRAHASRAIAGVAALAILVAAPTIVRSRRGAPAEAFQSAAVTTSFAALHSAPTHRLVVESRSSTRWPSSSDGPLPARGLVALAEPIQLRVAIAETPSHAGASADARGYDATAPPA